MIIDLSHAITSGMVTYPGLAAPELTTAVSRAETAARLAAGVSFEIESLILAGNTGTYNLGDPRRPTGSAVLLRTGWARHWGTPWCTGPDCPHLSADAVMAPVDAGPAVVGIDSLNIDDPNDPARPAHQGLLGAGIPPMGMASFPVRAVAVWPS
jgi:arylformamidase